MSTAAERNYHLCSLRLRIVTARLLLDLAGKVDADRLPDLLDFARVLGGADVAVDSVPAFLASQAHELLTAQAELDRISKSG